MRMVVCILVVMLVGAGPATAPSTQTADDATTQPLHYEVRHLSFSEANAAFAKVKNGMTLNQVQAILGGPIDTTENTNGITILEWDFRRDSRSFGIHITGRFEDGKLINARKTQG